MCIDWLPFMYFLAICGYSDAFAAVIGLSMMNRARERGFANIIGESSKVKIASALSRTIYRLPYLVGPPNSTLIPLSRIGVVFFRAR